MASVISQKDVAHHLRFLEAVRSYVFTLSKGHVMFVNGELRTTTAGNLLFHRSIYRLKLWITQVLRPKFHLDQSAAKGLQDVQIPPFDVLIILHSYMLHPHSFYEDSIRLNPELAILPGFPFEQAAARINESGKYTASAEQVAFWENATGERFDPPLETTETDAFAITCPGCRHSWNALWISALNDGAVSCDKCKLLITDEILGTAAFLHDIERAMSGDGIGLAGTLLTRKGTIDVEQSKDLTSRVATIIDYESIKKLPLDAVTERLKIFSAPEKGVKINCLNLYGHAGGFSTDLQAATLRQTKFASILHHAGWTHADFPLKAASTVAESISRYEGFLKLMANPEYGSLGPSKEIDLVWHTHQLTANYRTDVIRIVGFFLNHVDDSPKERLRESGDHAQEAWQQEFGTPYTTYFGSARFEVTAQ